MHDVMKRSIEATTQLYLPEGEPITTPTSIGRKQIPHLAAGQFHLLYKNSSKNHQQQYNNNHSTILADPLMSNNSNARRSESKPRARMSTPLPMATSPNQPGWNTSSPQKNDKNKKGKSGHHQDDEDHNNIIDAYKDDDRMILTVAGDWIRVRDGLPCPTRLLMKRRPGRVVEEGSICTPGSTMGFGTHIYAIRYPDAESLQRVVSGQDLDATRTSPGPRQEQCPPRRGGASGETKKNSTATPMTSMSSVSSPSTSTLTVVTPQPNSVAPSLPGTVPTSTSTTAPSSRSKRLQQPPTSSTTTNVSSQTPPKPQNQQQQATQQSPQKQSSTKGKENDNGTNVFSPAAMATPPKCNGTC